MRTRPAEEDRRGSVRVRRNIAVQFKRGLRITGQRWTSTVLRDISESGICISTGTAFAPDSCIRLRLKIPTEKNWLQISGRAIKSDKADTGIWTHVRLLKLDIQQKKDIRTYIAWVLVKEEGHNGVSGS
jgi:hypothetical protein